MDETTKTTKKKTGRPRKLTPYQKERIIGWIGEALVSRNECGKRLGIDDQTIADELQHDPIFAERVMEAEAYARDDLVGCVKKAAKEKMDYRAAQFLLQSKYWKEFAKKPDTYSTQDMMVLALKFSELVKKYVPEDAQLNFAGEVETIVKDMENQKKKQDN